MKNKITIIASLAFGIASLLLFTMGMSKFFKSLNDDHSRLQQENDSINVVISNLRSEAQVLSDSIKVVTSKLDYAKFENTKIKASYQNHIAELKQKPPQEIQHDFDSIYPTDGISPEHTIRTDQAMQAVVTHVEKNQAEDLLDNALQQISLLESINTIQQKEIANRDDQISLLELRNENTEQYYQALLKEKDTEISRAKRQKLLERSAFIILLAAGFLL